MYRSDRWNKEWGKKKRERKEERREEREWLVITEQLLNSEKEQVARREQRSLRVIFLAEKKFLEIYIYISLKKFREKFYHSKRERIGSRAPTFLSLGAIIGLSTKIAAAYFPRPGITKHLQSSSVRGGIRTTKYSTALFANLTHDKETLR